MLSGRTVKNYGLRARVYPEVRSSGMGEVPVFYQAEKGVRLREKGREIRVVRADVIFHFSR